LTIGKRPRNPCYTSKSRSPEGKGDREYMRKIKDVPRRRNRPRGSREWPHQREVKGKTPARVSENKSDARRNARIKRRNGLIARGEINSDVNGNESSIAHIPKAFLSKRFALDAREGMK